VLGPEEYVEKRGINSATTVLAMWRSLVKEADITVLAAERAKHPREAGVLRLRFNSYNAQRPSSSVLVWDISKVGLLRSELVLWVNFRNSGYGPILLRR